MMTTSWQVVVVYLHLTPRAQPCQTHLARSSPEDRPARFRLHHGLHSTEASQQSRDLHFPEGTPKAPGK